MLEIHQDHNATYEKLRAAAAAKAPQNRVLFERIGTRAPSELTEKYCAIADAVDAATQEGLAAPISDRGIEFLQALALSDSAEFVVDGFSEEDFDPDDAELMVRDALTHDIQYKPRVTTKGDLN